ncbi:MAG: hypothetical protein ACYC4D_03705 [Thermoleophilia bacterium]
MPDEYSDIPENLRGDFKVDTSNRHYQVTVYTDGLKIVGRAFWNVDSRSSSRRASDFLHSMPIDRITLASPRIYERATGLVIDEPEFVIINMNRIMAIYADEMADA